MNKLIKNILFLSIFALILTGAASKEDPNLKIIEQIKISEKEIPDGFVYGKVPKFASKVLKNNPWVLDTPAIKKMTPRIYPGGDANSVKAIHMTIVADKKRPFNDDIVCYIILYKDPKAAKEEIKKLNDFYHYNNDRTILITKETIAVFLLVDDIKNYHYIQEIKTSMEGKIKTL